MAKNWQITGTRKGVQVLSQTQVRDVMEISLITLPHEVFLMIEVGYTQGVLDGPNIIAEPIATGIEVILDLYPGSDASYAQEPRANGLLRGMMTFYILGPSPGPSQPGPFETTVVVPVEGVNLGVQNYTYVDGLVKAALAQLAKLAAL